MHVFTGIEIRNEGNDASVAEGSYGQPRFLPYFTTHAILGTLTVLKFSAHADPLVVILVVVLFGAVEHQIASVLLQIAKGRHFHASAVSFRFKAFRYDLRSVGMR